MNAKTEKSGKTYLSLGIDQDVMKEFRHLLVECFNSTKPMSAVLELFIRDCMTRMTPEEIVEAVGPKVKARYQALSDNMAAGRAKARAKS